MDKKIKFSLAFFALIAFIGCNHSPKLSVYQNDNLTQEIENVPSTDTTFEFGDYFLTVRYDNDQLIGSISNIDESKNGSFKCSDNAKVHLDSDGAEVECSMH